VDRIEGNGDVVKVEKRNIIRPAVEKDRSRNVGEASSTNLQKNVYLPALQELKEGPARKGRGRPCGCFVS
jgi:hypothetical protein